MGLNLLIDSADPSIWGEWKSYGIFQGITTNPTLLKKANQKCNLSTITYLIEEAEDLGFKEIHIQAWGNSTEKLIKTSLEISRINNNKIRVYVKIPVTEYGTKAAREIISKHIPVTLTACYEIKQVLIAAALGADYIAPYLGRIDDEDNNGEEDILKMKKTLKGLESSSKILVASIRSVDQILFLAKEGINTFTINPFIAKILFDSKKTIFDSKIFEEDSLC